MSAGGRNERQQQQYQKREKRRAIRALHTAISENKIDEVKARLTPEIDVNFHYSGQSALQIAVLKGYFDICQVLLNNGADVNKSNAEDNTLLNMAAWRGYRDIVALLVKHGAELDASNNHGSTALSTAAYKGHADIAHVLIQAGCSVNKQNQRGQSPLITAACEGHSLVADALLNADSKECDVDWADSELQTAIIMAATRGHASIVHSLIHAGCKIDIRERYGCTALHRAAQEGHCEVVRVLIQSGADLNLTDNRAVTPLLQAIKNQHNDVAKLLVQAGCDMNLCERDRHQAPIHEAVRQASQYFGGPEDEKLDMVRFLITAGCNLNVADKSGWTPLCQSAFGGEMEISSLLLDEGVKVDIATESGDTALHWAMFGNKPELIARMIKSDCDVNSVNKKNELPLYTAINLRADIKIIDQLLAAGSKTDVCERENHQSPLYIAVQHEYMEAAQKLLTAGCDVNLGDSNGDSPLWLACEKGNEEMVHLLLDQPSIDVNSGYKNFPLHAAADHGYLPIAKALLQAGADTNQLTDMSVSAIQKAVEARHILLVKLLIQWGADPSVQSTVRPPRRCCVVYSDRHPHLELEPMYAAVKNDHFLLMKLLFLGTPQAPYQNLKLLQDLVFRSGYAQDVRMDQQTLIRYAEFFSQVLSTPRPLQAECRGVIRQELGTNPCAKVPSLPLPTKLKEYVLLTKQLSQIPD